MIVDIPFDIDQPGWGSRYAYADGVKLPWSVDKWVIHYMGDAVDAGNARREYVAQIALEKATLKSVQNHHIDVRGWQDIAYNYAVGQSGAIYRLRGENRAGATRGDEDRDGIPENYEARAVLFILGGDQEPTEQALAAFHRLWSADPMRVIGHRDVFLDGVGGTDTQCPGEFLHGWLKDGGYAVDEEVAVPLKAYEQAAIDNLIEAGVFTPFSVDEEGEVDEYVPLKTIAVFLDRLLKVVSEPQDIGVDPVARLGVEALTESVETMKTILRSV